MTCSFVSLLPKSKSVSKTRRERHDPIKTAGPPTRNEISLRDFWSQKGYVFDWHHRQPEFLAMCGPFKSRGNLKGFLRDEERQKHLQKRGGRGKNMSINHDWLLLNPPMSWRADMIMRLRTGALINSFHEWKFTANVYLYFMNEILCALLD